MAPALASRRSAQLRVSGLDPSWTASDLLPVFASLPSFRAIHLHHSHDGQSKGWARAEFVGPAEAEAAEAARRGLQIEGRRIEVVSYEPETPGCASTTTQTGGDASLQPTHPLHPHSHVPEDALQPTALALPSLPASFAALIALPLVTIWELLSAHIDLPTAWNIQAPPTLALDLTQHWLGSRRGCERAEEGVSGCADRVVVSAKRDVRAKFDAMLKAWGYRSAQRGLVHTLLADEDVQALVYLLSCHPAVLKAVVQQRLDVRLPAYA